MSCNRQFYHLFLFLCLLMAAVPAAAQLAGSDISPGDACSLQGATTLSADTDQNGAGVVLICNGATWNPVEVQAGNDTGACDGTKTGRLRYASSTDTWEYCTGSAWDPFKDPCTDDGTGACWLDATRSDSDGQFTAANVANGVNILGITGTYDNRAPDCTNDSSVTCTLEATRDNDDAQFVSGNIRTGVNILNVTGSLANCSNDATGECILNATRSNSDGQFLAANIADGINVLGVTGTHTGCVVTWEGLPDLDDGGIGETLESAITLITTDSCSPNVAISGAGSPQYRICSAADCSTVPHDWTSGTTAIDDGEYIQARLTSSSALNTPRTATVAIGAAANEWTVTTGSDLPHYVAHATNSSAGTTSLAINKPAGTAQDDLMLAALSRDASGCAMSAPGGWTLLRAEESGPHRAEIYYKVAGGSEPSSYSFSVCDDNEDIVAAIVTIRNINTSNPIDTNDFDLDGGPSAITAPSLTTTVSDTLLLAMAFTEDGQSFTPPAGYTERVDLSLAEAGLSIATKLQSASGATGTAAFSPDADDDWLAEHIAVQLP